MVRLAVEVRRGDRLLEKLANLGHVFPSNCGGRGLCSRCRILVLEGRELLSRPTKQELALLSREELSGGWRLACQAIALSSGSLVLELPYLTYRLVVEGVEGPVELSPAVVERQLIIERPSLADLRADEERILSSLGANSMDIELLRELPSLLRHGPSRAEAIVRGGEVLDIRPPGRPLLGMAIDIGTTKIAAYLVDLRVGKLLSTSSDINPQVAFGEDIMSRIAFSMEGPDKLIKLSTVLRDGINKLIREACSSAGASPNDVYELVLVGNTVMHHSLLGISLRGLGLAPYTPATTRPLQVKARDLGLEAGRGAYAYLPPPIAGFVGSDALADLVASGMYELGGTCMLIDIGTNTEILLKSGDAFWACSCASGPAFEGWRISCGSRAVRGAIDSVRIEPGTYEVAYTTIGGAKPIGICGSGLIDAVAELYRAGILDASGRMREVGTPRLRRRQGVLEFVLAWASEAGAGHDIVITQKDIREIQLAKAAIRAGSRVLMEKAGVGPEDIDVLFIAGAFGSSLNLASAMAIGMCPSVPLSRVRFLGNSAGAGARMMLKNVGLRRKAEELAKHIKFVELAAEKEFREEFLRALSFPRLGA